VGEFTLAYSQNDTVYLLTKTVSFWRQIRIKQISLSRTLIIYVKVNYYTETKKIVFKKDVLTL